MSTQCTQDTIVAPSREMHPTKSYERTREIRSEPFPEEESSQDEHSEGTRMVLLPSTFPHLQENPYPEDETGGQNGARERDEESTFPRVTTSNETLPNPRPVSPCAPVTHIRMVREGKSRTRETRDMRRDMSDVDRLCSAFASG